MFLRAGRLGVTFKGPSEPSLEAEVTHALKWRSRGLIARPEEDVLIIFLLL